MNGLRSQNYVENKIPYTNRSTIDYFEVVDGRGREPHA